MNRHLLVAIDGSSNSKKALRYVADLYQGTKDINITLMTVSKPLPSFLTHGASSYQVEKTRLKKLEELILQQSRECASILENGKDILVRAGIEEQSVQCKCVAQGLGPVKDILLEAKRGLYDALVIGRRGLGRLAAYFMGSVTHGLLQQITDIPIWIVDEPASSKKILIALDACHPCLKVLDHAGFALAGLQGVQITVFHVIPKFRPFIGGEEQASFEDVEELIESHAETTVKDLLGSVKEIFSEAGIEKDDVQIKIKKGGAGVSHEILREYEKGGYGTLVMGRRGVGGWEAVFPGSVSNKILSSFNKGTTWIVT